MWVSAEHRTPCGGSQFGDSAVMVIKSTGGGGGGALEVFICRNPTSKTKVHIHTKEGKDASPVRSAVTGS